MVQVILCSGRNFIEHNSFSSTPCKCHTHAIEHFIFPLDVFLLRQVLRVAKCSYSSWNDRYFQQRMRIFKEPTAYGVSRLMIGDDPFLIGGNDFVLLLQSSNGTVNRVIEILH